MLHIGFIVCVQTWLFLPIFLRPLHPGCQGGPELAELALRRQRSHTEKPIPGACIISWLGTALTHDSLFSISLPLLCWFNSRHLECPLFACLSCPRFLLSFETHLAHTPFPRSNLGWPNLGPRDNFHGWQVTTSPHDNWSYWEHLPRKRSENTRGKKLLRVAGSS